MALAGGLHCSVMCGPLSLAAGCKRRDSIGYIATRSLGYVVLGALAGAFGGALGVRFPAWGQVLAGIIGVSVMLLVALRANGASSLGRALGRLTSRAPSMRGPLLGVVTLALPCGLLHGALALAWISGSMRDGAIVLLVFAALTAPFVMASRVARALIERRLSPRHAVWFERTSIWLGVFVVTGRTFWAWYAGPCH